MNFAVASTESQLKDWSTGQTGTERLCADVFRLDGFVDIDPQAPFGGPDGGKDLLCSKDDVTYVAAVYFPKGQVTFSHIKRKFSDDLKKSLKYGRKGFIFFSNQHLTPGERTKLELISSKAGKLCLIYHRERIRVALDSPQGFGLRLAHLRIPLSPEEQFAYFTSSKDDVATALFVQARAIEKLSDKITRLGSLQMDIAATTVAAVASAVRGEGVDLSRMLSKAAEQFLDPTEENVSASLSSPLIRLIHRLIMPEGQIAGRYRATQVWLSDPTGILREPYEPPSWDQVPLLMDQLVKEWNESVPAVSTGSGDEKIAAVARFFWSLLSIHPFVDGNGRLARQLLAIQCRDLFGLREDILLEKGSPYYRALRKADQDDLSDLEELIGLAVGMAA